MKKIVCLFLIVLANASVNAMFHANRNARLSDGLTAADKAVFLYGHTYSFLLSECKKNERFFTDEYNAKLEWYNQYDRHPEFFNQSEWASAAWHDMGEYIRQNEFPHRQSSLDKVLQDFERSFMQDYPYDPSTKKFNAMKREYAHKKTMLALKL